MPARISARRFSDMGFALALAVLAGLGWVTYRNTSNFLDEVEERKLIILVRRGFIELLSEIKDTETGMRGYVITGDIKYLEPYHNGRASVTQQLEYLRSLMPERPDRAAQLQTIQGLIDKKFANEEQAIAARKTRGFDAAREFVATGLGQQIMDEIRRSIGAIVVEETANLYGSWDESTVAGRHMLAIIPASSVVTILLVGVAGIVLRREIGQRQRSEEETRQQKALLESIIDNMSEGVSVADLKGKFLLQNAAGQKIVGRGMIQAPVGEWPAQYGVYLPDGSTPYPADQLPLARALRGESVDRAEMQIRHAQRPGGVWLEVTARPLPGPDGAPVGGLAVFHDITERRRAEAEIRALNAGLERRVLERTAELARTNQDLAHKNQENEMFVYSVSHDLRSPLVNLQGFSKELSLTCFDLRSILNGAGVPDQVRERGLALVDTDMAESIRFIQTGVMRLSSIIDALLRLSRAGRVEYRPQRVEVRSMVSRIVDSMKGTIEDKAATVSIDDLPPAWGDSAALEQVFANLIGNALNYLDVHRPGKIAVGACIPGDGADGITYWVKDNGLGIPESFQAKMFQAFQRGHPNAAAGEGMGLAIVRRIVERHHGKVWVESAKEEGTTFFVFLPPAPGPGTDLASKPAKERTAEP